MSAAKRLRILFDGTVINETPMGWEDIVSSITRVQELNSVFVTTEANLTFFEDGYNYLIRKHDDGFCNIIQVELQEYCNGVYEKFFDGYIFISSSVIDRKQCSIKVKIEDNSFYAKINNNKSLEVYPYAEKSKNNLDIAACPYEKVQMFVPSDASYVGVLVNPPYTGACYPVYELFKYLITFMSDSEIEFESDLFGPGGDYEGLTITCGIVLRQYLDGGTTFSDFKDNFPKLSFSKLFSEVNKKINIGMYVDYSQFVPKIRIERARDIRSTNVSFQALNIDELKESIDVEKLYSSMRLGSNQTSDKVYTVSPFGLSFPEDISYFGYKNEQFIVLGQCNIDRELDLVSDFIISSNVIEDCFIHGETDYDNDIFFIMCDVSIYGNYSAQQDTLYQDGTGVAPVFYNTKLTNKVATENYFGGMPNSIAQYLGNGDDTFLAEKTAIQTFPGPFISSVDTTYGLGHVRYEDDYTPPNFDNNDRYGNGTTPGTPVNTLNSRFDALLGGTYAFATNTQMNFNIVKSTYIFYSNNNYFYNFGDVVEFRSIGGGTVYGTGRVYITETGGTYKVYIYAQSGSNPVASNEIWKDGVYIDDVAGSTLPEAFTAGDGSIDIIIHRFDSGGIPIISYTHNHGHTNGLITLLDTFSINMNSGDYIYVSVIVHQAAYTFNAGGGVLQGSTFGCTFTFNGGGVYQTYDPADYPIIKHDWEYPITKEDFNDLMRNQTYQIEFARDGGRQFNGWINSVKYKRFREEKATFSTYTSKNNIK